MASDAAATPSGSARERVRPAGRHDVSALVDLRVHYLGEASRLARRPGLPPDARARAEALWPVWLGQEERVVLVVPPGPVAGGSGGAGDAAALAGYAMGSVSTWPPLFRRTKVGEVLEVFVDPADRGQGLGRALLEVLTEVLCSRGAEVLRAPVGAHDANSLARFAAQGYRPWQHVLVRRLDER